MEQADIKRVREDLETMKRAVGTGLPIGRADVGLSLAWAAAGVPLVAWTAYAPPGRTALGLLIVLPCLGVLLLSGFVAGKCRRDRAQSPAPWREHRFQWLAAAVLTPAFAGFLIWGLARGLSAESLVITALFMAGLGLLLVPVVDRSRLFYLGWAVFTMLFAVAIPLVAARYHGLLTGGWLILSGLSAAAIMLRQLNRRQVEDATH